MKVSSVNRASVLPQSDVTRVNVRSSTDINRVQVRSVNWSELARQVEENTLELLDHEDRINNLELTTERLEERVSANEQTTEGLVHLINTKMIVFSELGE